MISYNNSAPNAVNNVGQFGATEGSIGAYKSAAEYAADSKYWAMLSQKNYNSIDEFLKEVERLYAEGSLLKEDIEQLKYDFENQNQMLLGLIQQTGEAIDNTNTAIGEANAATDRANQAVQDVLTQLDKISNMSVVATTLPPGAPATGSFDNSTGVFSFGIPEGQPGKDGTDGTISDIGDVTIGTPVADDYGFFVDKDNGGLYRTPMSEIAKLVPAVVSFNGRTGPVVPAAGDYTVSQVTGAAASGVNNDINQIRGLTTALSVAQGGTAAKNADDARTNLSAMFESKTALGTNTNLNDINGTTSGFYYQSSSARAKPELNYPTPLAGSLMVLNDGANSGYSCIQIYFVHNDPRITYSRVYNSGTDSWSNWAKSISTERLVEMSDYTDILAPGGTYRLRIRSDGQWGTTDGSVWVPLELSKGGTGATTVDGARANLKIDRFSQSTEETSFLTPNSNLKLSVNNNGLWGCYNWKDGVWNPLGVGQGGTGATTADAARISLVAAKSGANSDITSMTNSVTFTQPVSVADAVDATNAVNLGQISSDQGASLIGTLEGVPVQNIISNINTDIIQLKLNWAIENGYSDAGFTFTTGGTLTVDDRDKVVYDPVSKTWYSYSGTFPVTVPAGFNPVGNADWKPQTDPQLREELSAKDGYSLLGELTSVAGFSGLVGASGSRVKLKSWYASAGVQSGGGEFIFVSTMPKTSHNGGTIISPSVPYGTVSSFLAGTGETDPSGSGCWVRDFDGPINALWFGAVGNGTTDNSAQLAAFRNAVVGQTAKRRGYIPAGTYAYATGPNYAVKGVHIYGDGKNNTILKNTSGERAFRIDGAEYGMAAVFDVVVENIGIEGHAGTQHLVYVENASHLTMRNINLREASPTTGNAMSLLWTVASVFENITCSINEQPITNKPYYGIVLSTSPSRNLKSTANLFINAIIEGVGGTGIRLVNTDLNTFIGGTSEANGTYGITAAGESRQNKFVGMGFEANGAADLLDGGQDTVLENCYTGKSIVLIASSRRARIVGGLHERIEMQTGCSAANIENLTINYFDTGNGGIYDSGTNSSFRNVFDLDANAYVYPTKLRQPITVTASPFTFTNTTGEYQNVLTTGGTVTSIQFSRGGSQTMTGMTAGLVMLAPGDSLVVSYSVAPVMSRIPMGNNIV